MRIATIVGGFVTAIVDLEMAIDANALAARGPARHSVHHPDGTVEQVDYEAVYPAPANGLLVAATDGVSVGFTHDGSGFHAPAEAALTPADLRAHAARKRFELETSGLKAGGVEIATDRATQAMVALAASVALVNKKFQMHWQTPGGEFVLLNADAIKAMASAVGQHVADAAECEATAAAGIKAGTIATRDQVDAVFAA